MLWIEHLHIASKNPELLQETAIYVILGCHSVQTLLSP